MNFWDKKIETMSGDEMAALQSERLVKMIDNVYRNVPHYRAKMDEKGIKPEDIKSIEDLPKLPFTKKDDLRDTYPYGMFARPIRDITRIHASSGTTGKQTVVGYTKNDIDMWAECVARELISIGFTKEDILQVSYGYGLFTGGLGLHYGGEKSGVAVIPMSSGNTKRQIQNMVDFGSTGLCCTPSYALFLADELLANGITPKDTKMKFGVFGAEPWSEEMRNNIQEKMGIIACDIYGLSEVMGPGVSCECSCRKGMHIQEDNFIAEIIDPITEKVLPPGTPGEIVFTTITKEGLPLVRYRTRDLTYIIDEKCECGRTLARMARITGRTDDMLIIRGVNVFPSQIETVLLKINETAPHYMIYVDRVGGLDVMEVHVEINEFIFHDEVRKIETLEKKISSELQSVLGISAKIKLVEPRSLPRSEGKAKRVIDNRKL